MRRPSAAAPAVNTRGPPPCAIVHIVVGRWRLLSAAEPGVPGRGCRICGCSAAAKLRGAPIVRPSQCAAEASGGGVKAQAQRARHRLPPLSSREHRQRLPPPQLHIAIGVCRRTRGRQLNAPDMGGSAFIGGLDQCKPITGATVSRTRPFVTVKLLWGGGLAGGRDFWCIRVTSSRRFAVVSERGNVSKQMMACHGHPRDFANDKSDRSRR